MTEPVPPLPPELPAQQVEPDARDVPEPPPITLTDSQAREMAGLVEKLSDDDLGRAEKGKALVRMSNIIGSRARAAGAKAVTSGRLLADLLVEAAPHIPVRDLDTLIEHHHGLTGEALADALVKNATRATTSIGAAGGAVAAAEWAAMPLLITVPAEVLVETMAVAAVEVKLVAELHAVYGVPVPGTGAERAMSFAGSWASRRGIDPLRPWTIPNVLGIAGRATLGKRLIARFARNLGTIIPFFVGAAIGASVNNAETKKLAASMRTDLRRVAAELRPPEPGAGP
jgi:hypothetical protein